MKYPAKLMHGGTIGVCAPSSGLKEGARAQFENAILNVEALGYRVIETMSVRKNEKCVSADSVTRAAEFSCLYENPHVSAILPPWGGEFLMDMLEFIDYDKIAALPPKWVCGYSDITTLTFPLTLCCDIATIHGSNFFNMGYREIAPSDMAAFKAMREDGITQKSAQYWGTFTSYGDITVDTYNLTVPNIWKTLSGLEYESFEGRMIGGCLDTLCKLLGTRFAPVECFNRKYGEDGIIWTLESCEMNAGDIYRSLWQMRQCGWFENASGFLFGRPAGYSDTKDFELTDALLAGLGGLEVPVIYDADIGHTPPQMQVVNGSYAHVEIQDGKAIVAQEYRR